MAKLGQATGKRQIMIGVRVKEILKRFPGAKSLWERLVEGPKKMTIIPLEDLKAFAPNVAGHNLLRNRLAVATAQRTGRALREAHSAFHEPAPVVNASAFAHHFDLTADYVDSLGQTLRNYGSDKSTTHDYHHVYGRLFPRPAEVELVLEVGIGTNSPDVMSTMGSGHEGVGGSLRAWRDFFSNANVIGFDVDPNVMFEESRIRTGVMDQLDEASVAAALCEIEDETVTLYIDDGMHALDANLLPIKFVFPKLASGGWMIIEDIHAEAVPFWQSLAMSVPRNLGHAAVVSTRSAFLFVLRKAENTAPQET